MDLLAKNIDEALVLGQLWLGKLMSPKLELGSPDDFNSRTSWMLPLTLCLLKRDSIGATHEAATRSALQVRDAVELCFKMPNCPSSGGWKWNNSRTEKGAVDWIYGHPVESVTVSVCSNTGWEWTAYMLEERWEYVKDRKLEARAYPASFHEFRMPD